MRHTLHLLSVFLVLLLAGCAAQHSYRDGNAYLGRGDYDRAVRAFEDAVERDPKNTRYTDALQHARTEACAAHLQRARAHLASRSLGSARGEANSALQFLPDDADAVAFLRQIDAEIGRAQAKRVEALRLRQEKAWDEAIAAIEEAIEIDHTLRDASSDLSSIRSSAAEHEVVLARESLRNNVLDQAERHARSALRYDHASRSASQVLDTIANRRRAAEILAEAQDRIGRREFEKALGELSTADRLFPGHAPILEAIQACRTSLADRYAALQAEHLAASRWGNALVLSLLANAYEPDRVPPSQIGECIDHLYERLAYRVAIVGYRAQADTLEPVAQAMSTATAQQVLANKPENVSIMERADLEAILAEQNLTLSDLFDPAFAVAPGKLRGVDALIVGQVIEGSVTNSREQLTGVSQYQSGTRWVENPGYGFAQMSRDTVARNVRNIEADLASSQRSLQSAYSMRPSAQRDELVRFAQQAVREKTQRLESARAALAAEEQRLAQVPRQLEEVVISNYRYPIEKVTKTGRVRFAFKMMDTELGELLVAEVLHGQYVTSDNQIQADPARNVPGDPLQIDDDDAVLARALDDAMRVVEEPARRAVESHGTRFLILGRRAMRGNQNDVAVENFVNFLFAYPTDGDEHNEVLDALNSLVPHDGDLISLRKELERVLPNGRRRSGRRNETPTESSPSAIAAFTLPLFVATVGVFEPDQDESPQLAGMGVLKFQFGTFPYFDDGGFGRDYRTRDRLGDLTAYLIRLFPEVYLSEHHPSRFEGQREAGLPEPSVISSYDYGSITIINSRQLDDPATRTAITKHLSAGNALEVVISARSSSSLRLQIPKGTYYLEYSLEFRNARLQHGHVHPNYPSVGGDDRDLRWGLPKVDVHPAVDVEVHVQPSDNINFYKYDDGDDPPYADSRAFRDFKKYLNSTGEWEPFVDQGGKDERSTDEAPERPASSAPESIPDLTARAEAGDVEAMDALGLRYETGTSVARDDAAAHRWYSEASRLGHAPAMVHLAGMYADGRVVDQSDEGALRLYVRAADLGNTRGMLFAATMFEEGRGGNLDEQKALELTRRAAEGGLAPAMTKLGAKYMTGRGVMRDQAKGFEWTLRAAELGESQAMFSASIMFARGDGTAANETESTKWMMKAAEGGHADAMFYVGKFYDAGVGVNRNGQLALQWYRRAADAGSEKARALLANRR